MITAYAETTLLSWWCVHDGCHTINRGTVRACKKCSSPNPAAAALDLPVFVHSHICARGHHFNCKNDGCRCACHIISKHNADHGH